MPIDFIPFKELFAPEYQLNYISPGGNITVGPYTYNVFVNYSVVERQKAFQDCEKYLPWETSEEQEHWERAMYMYQCVIKSPSPFPYLEYILSEDIMAIEWELKISTVNVAAKRADASFTRTDTESTLAPQTYSYKQTVVTGDTPEETAILRQKLLDTVKFNVMKDEEQNSIVEAMITNLEQAGKAALETWEAGR